MTEQILVKNFELLKTQAAKAGSRGEKLVSLLDTNAERIILAPASTRLDLVCAYPGGLVEHSIRVLMLMAKARNAYGLLDTVPAESVIVTALFHDIGKIGTESKEYYIDNDSEWHRNKLGQMYKVVEKLQHLSVSQLSLMLLTKNGVQLDIDEWYAVSSIRDRTRDNDVPVSGEPMLAVLLQQAVKMAIMAGKGKLEPTLVG